MNRAVIADLALMVGAVSDAAILIVLLTMILPLAWQSNETLNKVNNQLLGHAVDSLQAAVDANTAALVVHNKFMEELLRLENAK